MSGRVSPGTPLSRQPHSDSVRHAFEDDGLLVTATSSIANLLEGEEEMEGGECAGSSDGGKQRLLNSGVEGGVVVTMPPTKPRPPSAKRILPTPPSGRPDLPPRPHTVAEFRVRRLRRHSAEVSLLSQGVAEVVDQTHFDGAELGKEGQWSSTE